jgi:hypothetical protein
MLKEGARVYHSGHGLGIVVAHNTRQPNSYAAENLGSEVVAMAVGMGLADAIVSSMYDGARYPYVIQFDSGYKDVYALDDVTEVVVADPEETQT